MSPKVVVPKNQAPKILKALETFAAAQKAAEDQQKTKARELELKERSKWVVQPHQKPPERY